MKLPTIQRFQKQNYPGSSNWFTRFIEDMNSFSEIIWNILNRNITLGDNLDAQIYSFTLLAGAAPLNNTVSFLSTMKHIPQALFVGNVVNTAAYTAVPATAVWAAWSFSNPTITVNAITGLTTGQTYQVTLVGL